MAYRGRELQGWAGDHVLCADYDSVTVASVGHPLPIIPDGTFTLDGAGQSLMKAKRIENRTGSGQNRIKTTRNLLRDSAS